MGRNESMRKRPFALAVLMVGLAVSVPLTLSLGGDNKNPAGGAGKPVDFQLPDTAKTMHQLSAIKDKKAYVVVFLGTACPINNLYLPRLNELHEEFGKQGIQFFAINS